MSYQELKSRLDRGENVVLDGGTGTELERRGVPMSEAAWCGLACLSHPATVTEVHKDYIEAGAEIITANSFASSRLMLDLAGMGDRLDEVIGAAMGCAKRARDASKTTNIAIAGSISHMVPLAPGSNSIIAGEPEPEVLRAVFTELALALARHGADFLLLEMMYHPVRAQIALEAACSVGLPVWCGMSVRRSNDGRVLSFSRDVEMDFHDVAALLSAHPLDAAGIMHSSADVSGDALAIIKDHFAGPLMVYPDSGFFAMPHWQFVDVMTPVDLVSFANQWQNAGAQIIGGCCGLGVEHIRALAASRSA